MIGRVLLSLFCAGVLYTAWLAAFLLTAGLDSSVVRAIRWLLAPVVTAAGFAAGIAISERLTRVRKSRFLRILIWPLVGCAVGAGVVYWFGPMLIVFAMFAAGTASVILREVILSVEGEGNQSRSRERIPGREVLDDPEVARAFGRIAEMPQMRLLRQFVARRAVRMVRRGEAVDLGCGPGHLAIQLAHHAPGLHVTGVDLSDEMLSQGKECVRHTGISDRVSFRKGDVRQIPFPDDSLDLVVSTLSLHHWSDPVAVLDEIARVLRRPEAPPELDEGPDEGHPGGSFLIFDLRRDLAMPFWLLLWFATHFVVPATLRRVNEPMGSRNAAYTPGEAAELAERSRLSSWRVTRGPLWLTIEGTMQ